MTKAHPSRMDPAKLSHCNCDNQIRLEAHGHVPLRSEQKRRQSREFGVFAAFLTINVGQCVVDAGRIDPCFKKHEIRNGDTRPTCAAREFPQATQRAEYSHCSLQDTPWVRLHLRQLQRFYKKKTWKYLSEYSCTRYSLPNNPGIACLQAL